MAKGIGEKAIVLVNSFTGIDTFSNERNLELGASPDMLNALCDGHRLIKRAGYERLSTEAIRARGVKLDNTLGAPNTVAKQRINIPHNTKYDLDAYDASTPAEWTIGLGFVVPEMSTTYQALCAKGSNSGDENDSDNHQSWSFVLWNHMLHFTINHSDGAAGISATDIDVEPVQIGKAYRMVVTYVQINATTGTIKIYVNEELRVTQTITHNGSFNNDTKDIDFGATYVPASGAWGGGYSYGFNGSLDWFLFDDNSEWSASKITSYCYRELSSSDPSGMTGYFVLSPAEDLRWANVVSTSEYAYVNETDLVLLERSGYTDRRSLRCYGDSGVKPEVVWSAVAKDNWVGIFSVSGTDKSLYWAVRIKFRFNKISASTDHVVLSLPAGISGAKTDAAFILYYSVAAGLDGTLTAYVKDEDGTQLAATYVPGSWSLSADTDYEIYVVRDDDTLYLYLDSVLLDSTTVVATSGKYGLAISNDDAMGIGWCALSGSYSYDITVHQLVVRNRAVGQSEITATHEHDEVSVNEDGADVSALYNFGIDWNFSNHMNGSDAITNQTSDPNCIENGRGTILPLTKPVIKNIEELNRTLVNNASAGNLLADLRQNPLLRRIVVRASNVLYAQDNKDGELTPILTSMNRLSHMRFETFGNYLIFGDGESGNYYYDGFVLPSQLGITASSTELSATVGATGNVPHSSGGLYYYYYVFTFYDPDTGWESNASPVHIYQATGTNVSKKVELSSIDTSSGMYRKIYRSPCSTVGDLDPGLYLYLDTIEDDSTTVYSDNTAQAGLSYAVSSKNNVLEACTLFCKYRNVLFAAGSPANPNTLFPSLPGLPSSFPSTYAVDINLGDGDYITALESLDTLIIFKTKSIILVYGSSPETIYYTALETGGIGCDAPATIVKYGGTIFFLANDNTLRVFSGGEYPKDISQPIKGFLDDIDTDEKDKACAVYDTASGVYILNILLDTGSRKELRYHVKEHCWTAHDVAATAYGRLTDGTVLAGLTDGHVVELNSGSTDGLGDTEHSGEATSVATTSLTDTGASFPTAGDGLSGIELYVLETDGTEHTIEILYNTATIIYFATESFSDATPEYWVAPVKGYWKSKRFGDDEMVGEFLAKHIIINHKEELVSGDYDLTTECFTQNDGSASAESTVDATKRDYVAKVDKRAKDMQLEIKDYGYVTFDICSIGALILASDRVNIKADTGQ